MKQEKFTIFDKLFDIETVSDQIATEIYKQRRKIISKDIEILDEYKLNRILDGCLQTLDLVEERISEIAKLIKSCTN